MPDAFAVWKVYPEAYNASAFPARGGKLWQTGPSPTMVAFDSFGNAFVSLDRVDNLVRISTDDEAEDIHLPSILVSEHGGEVWDFSNGNGPGIVSGPDGSVWLTNLGAAHPWLVRFLPGSNRPTVVKLADASDGRHLIHLAFSERAGPSGNANVLYGLTSALLKPEADEAVMIAEFDANWTAPLLGGEVGQTEFQLGHDNAAAHRITVAEGLHPRALLVTGLLTNTLYQISGSV